MKKTIALALAALMLLALLTACAAKPAETEPAELEQTVQTEQPAEPETDETAEDADASAEEETPAEPALPDGVYTADFNTDSSMFHVNEACDGKGTLTVENGEMTIHVSLAGTSILNLFPGVKEDAEKEGAELLQPTTDTVTYSDGLSDEVFGFDIPVPTLDEEFDLALIGKKGTWYDHKVSVRKPQPIVEDTASDAETEVPEDGTYTCNVTLEGGSGRATIESPTELTVADGKMTAEITWSSPNYDYMIVDGEKYLPVNTEGNSVFEIPVAALDTALAVTADTTAMSSPHEIEYPLTFDSASLTA